jgi:hypothetical protein
MWRDLQPEQLTGAEAGADAEDGQRPVLLGRARDE